MIFIGFQCQGRDTLIRHIHTHFDRWETEGTLTPPLDEDAFHRARLVVHEWLANLVQHADFKDRVPTVVVRVRAVDYLVYCSIEDNSEGFDLARQLEAGVQQREAFPERGFGLHLMKACTEALSYHSVGEARHRLSFYIAAYQDPQVEPPLYLPIAAKPSQRRLVA